MMTTLTLPMGLDIDRIDTVKVTSEVKQIKSLLKSKQSILLTRLWTDLFNSDERITCLVWSQKQDESVFSRKQSATIQDIHVGVGTPVLTTTECEEIIESIGFDPLGGLRVNDPDKDSKYYTAAKYVDLVYCPQDDFGLLDVEGAISEESKLLARQVNLIMQDECKELLIEKLGLGCTVLLRRDLTLVSVILD